METLALFAQVSTGDGFLDCQDGWIALFAFLLVGCPVTAFYARASGLSSLMAVLCCLSIPLALLALVALPMWGVLLGLLAIGLPGILFTPGTKAGRKMEHLQSVAGRN